MLIQNISPTEDTLHRDIYIIASRSKDPPRSFCLVDYNDSSRKFSWLSLSEFLYWTLHGFAEGCNVAITQLSEPNITKHGRRKKKVITHETNQQGQESCAPLLHFHMNSIISLFYC